MIGIDHRGNILKKIENVFFKLDTDKNGFYKYWKYDKKKLLTSSDDHEHVQIQHYSWKTVTGDIYLDKGFAYKKLDNENAYALCLDDRNGGIWLHSFLPTSSIRAFTIATPEEIEKVKELGGRAKNKVFDEET